jgi:FixJ family two-component response regulator
MSAAEQPPIVVVIEDDDGTRAALGRLLRAGGFEPALFDSAETFIASRLDRAPLCLIVDVHLTGMSGLDLQDRLRRQRSQIAIIVTTADRRQVIRQRAQNAGCAAFLSKPLTGDAVLSVLASIAGPHRLK